MKQENYCIYSKREVQKVRKMERQINFETSKQSTSRLIEEGSRKILLAVTKGYHDQLQLRNSIRGLIPFD